MYVAKRGNPAPAEERNILLAASAEAALVHKFVSSEHVEGIVDEAHKSR